MVDSTTKDSSPSARGTTMPRGGARWPNLTIRQIPEPAFARRTADRNRSRQRLIFMEHRSPPALPDEERLGSARRHQDDDLLAPSDAAKVAARSVRTIRRAYTTGRLTAFRDRSGRGVRIRYIDLRNWMLGEEISPIGDDVEVARSVPPSTDASPGSREQSLSLLRAARSARGSRRGPTFPVS
jgi:hypothetical protein